MKQKAYFIFLDTVTTVAASGKQFVGFEFKGNPIKVNPLSINYSNLNNNKNIGSKDIKKDMGFEMEM